MRRGSRIDGRVAILMVAALAVAPLAFGGCGSSGGGGGTPPPGALAVSASPAGGNFASAQDVTLAATGEGSSTAVIYYTTDLSEPEESVGTTMEYTGPINVGSETVLKFYAVPTTGDPTDVALEGYTFETSGIGTEWAESGHGDIAGEPWRHWDEDGEVSTSCAKCHSGDGFNDWALDGTVDAAAPLPYGLSCSGCHDGIPSTLYDDTATYTALELVEFPSEAEVTLGGDSNLCIACHQGRSSGPDLQDKIDGGSPPYSFTNIHYYAAAASYFGTETEGGYQYPGEEYQPRNTFGSHPDSLSTCTGCHMREDDKNHTWFPDLNRCLECHTGNNFTTLSGSPGTNYAAIQTALTELYAEIQDYADTVLGEPVEYDGSHYPYWFHPDGTTYVSFDATLLKAAYNYQFGLKEPCGYIHNGIYMRQLFHDSIVDLGGTPTDIPPARTGYTTPSNMFVAKTNQWRLSGHGASGGEPFRHWDDETPPPTVSASCARCHSSPGFEGWALDGTEAISPSPVSAVGCIACHQSGNLYSNDETRWDDTSNLALRPPAGVEFPSTATADLGNASNLCMGCHQGRESGPDVQAVIDAGPGPYTFLNIHYYPAAAVFFGADVEGGYQYRAGSAYAGPVSWPGSHSGNNPSLTTCIGCHMRGDADHSFLPQPADCEPCHGSSLTGFEDNLGGTPGANYTAIQSLLTDLYTAIQAYATGTIGTGIFYDASAYPYFFKEGGPAEFSNRYDLFDATLLTAAYNYQVGQKEPCGYIHNGDYMRQILYDALDQLDDGLQNDSVAGQTRP